MITVRPSFFHLLLVVLLLQLTPFSLRASGEKGSVIGYGSLCATFTSVLGGGLENRTYKSPRGAIALIHWPSGLGLGFAAQDFNHELSSNGISVPVYDGGLFSMAVVGTRSVKPVEGIQIRSITFIKELGARRSVATFAIEAGPCFVQSKRDSLEAGATHFHSYTDRAIGLTVRCRMMMLMNNWLGLEAAFRADMNKLRPVLAIDLGLVLGRLRKDRSTKV